MTAWSSRWHRFVTQPYFHDGKIKTLDEAVRKMGALQLDDELTDQQVSDITSFLKALTDKKREQYIKEPLIN